MISWLIGAPVWLQAPIVVAIVLPGAAALAAGISALMRRVIPVHPDERPLTSGGVFPYRLGGPRTPDAPQPGDSAPRPVQEDHS